MPPVLFVSLPFLLLLLISRLAGTSKTKTDKTPEAFEYQDGDIIIIRRKSGQKS
ncbi:MAG: hypothetical protein AAFN42_11315 [Cyanobacteria bacterium J06554_1]